MLSIFSPLSFITGVYGMNFVNIPELHWQHGYTYFWGIATVTTMVTLGKYCSASCCRLFIYTLTNQPYLTNTLSLYPFPLLLTTLLPLSLFLPTNTYPIFVLYFSRLSIVTLTLSVYLFTLLPFHPPTAFQARWGLVTWHRRFLRMFSFSSSSSSSSSSLAKTKTTVDQNKPPTTPIIPPLNGIQSPVKIIPIPVKKI